MSIIINNGQFKAKDISGVRVGNLIVVHPSTKSKWGVWYWKCKCDCGNETEVLISHLTSGRKTKSCGCLKNNNNQNKTHGLRYHPMYQVWRSMKYRCYNEKAQNYLDYGGRGIKVCDRWRYSFQNFYDDMKEGYIKGEVMIDRIKVNENYTPDNCRWETYIGSANNKRTSKYLSLNGVVRTATEWSRLLGVRADTIRQRKEKGYADSICLSTTSILTKKNISILIK